MSKLVKEKLRRAKPDDIQIGTTIYYPDGDKKNPFIKCVVKDLLIRGDPYKAYEAEDGCRYGLKDAYVIVKRKKA